MNGFQRNGPERERESGKKVLCGNSLSCFTFYGLSEKFDLIASYNKRLFFVFVHKAIISLQTNEVCTIQSRAFIKSRHISVCVSICIVYFSLWHRHTHRLPDENFIWPKVIQACPHKMKKTVIAFSVSCTFMVQKSHNPLTSVVPCPHKSVRDGWPA